MDGIGCLGVGVFLWVFKSRSTSSFPGCSCSLAALLARPSTPASSGCGCWDFV
jgi:hypothetical protein